jgi:hypothetical protein
MSAKVSFLKEKLPTDQTPRLSLPKEALVGTAPSLKVWHVHPNTTSTTEKKSASTLESILVQIEEEPEKGIVTLRNTTKLKVGDSIVLNPEASFKDGQSVKVAP